jgi:hypothetical protein
LDPLVSPAIVLDGEPLDERGDLGVTDCRPVGFGQVHFRLTRRRCQRRTVPGVTSRCARSRPCRSRISAAITALAPHWASSALAGCGVTDFVAGEFAVGQDRLRTRNLLKPLITARS